MSTRDQFDAAVKVIQNLPKNGPYQPSNDMMLMFYSLFKQATIGPCNIPKPAFWDIINKAKWNAWSALGGMSKEDAMGRYVEEIKKIVETMSLTTDVEELLEALGPFYEYVKEEDSGVEMESGAMSALLGKFSENISDDKLVKFNSRMTRLEDEIETARQLIGEETKLFGDQPEADQEAEVVEEADDDRGDEDDDGGSRSEDLSEAASTNPIQDYDRRAYPEEASTRSRTNMARPPSPQPFPVDPLSAPVRLKSGQSDPASSEAEPTANFPSETEDEDELYEDTQEELFSRNSTDRRPKSPDRIQALQNQMEFTVQRLERDLNHVMARMSTLEKLAAFNKNCHEHSVQNPKPSGIPFAELTGPTTLLLIMWPFAVHGIISLIKSAAKKS